MQNIITNFPEQLLYLPHIDNNSKLPKKRFSNIIVCGMGGSALPGEILRMYLKNAGLLADIPVHLNRTYTLPQEANHHSLIIAISYSGNTEETLASYTDAKKRKVPIVGIASGGKLQQRCKKDSVPFIPIPSGYQPRMALGFFVSALAVLLEEINMVKHASSDLQETAPFLTNNMSSYKRKGNTLAQNIGKSIPIVYSSHTHKMLAIMWKINFNENAKIQSFFNAFPELNHNEMVGFTNMIGSYHFLILEDGQEDARIKRRMQLFAQFMRKRKVPTTMIPLVGKTFLEKTFSSILTSLWTSYFLATNIYHIDPIPVDMVEEFKKKL